VTREELLDGLVGLGLPVAGDPERMDELWSLFDVQQYTAAPARPSVRRPPALPARLYGGRACGACDASDRSIGI
jgi:hypothetical protein